MRQNDLLKSDTGDHLRVLLYGDQQSYVVNCQRCKMPFPISTPSLLQMEKLPQDMYRLLSLDEDISERQRQQRDRRAELIAPLLVEEIFELIKLLNESGTTILLVEQNAQMALSIADRGYVLETGRIVSTADAKELLNDDAVRKAYLGG